METRRDFSILRPRPSPGHGCAMPRPSRPRACACAASARAISTPRQRRWRDPEVVRHLGGRPFSREETWRKILASPGLWALLGYGYWVVERREDGAYLGQIGFADFKRDMTPGIEGMPEMGWIFAPRGPGPGLCHRGRRCARSGLGRRGAGRRRDRRDHRATTMRRRSGSPRKPASPPRGRALQRRANPLFRR